MFVKIFSLTQT